MPRRAQTNTPPKPASDIFANAMKSAVRLGGAETGISGAGTATGDESAGMGSDLERCLGKANPYFAYSKPVYLSPLVSSPRYGPAPVVPALDEFFRLCLSQSLPPI